MPLRYFNLWRKYKQEKIGRNRGSYWRPNKRELDYLKKRNKAFSNSFKRGDKIQLCKRSMRSNFIATHSIICKLKYHNTSQENYSPHQHPPHISYLIPSTPNCWKTRVKSNLSYNSTQTNLNNHLTKKTNTNTYPQNKLSLNCNRDKKITKNLSSNKPDKNHKRENNLKKTTNSISK